MSTQTQTTQKQKPKTPPPEAPVKNEVATRASNLPSTDVQEQHQEVLNSDIIIPSLYLMQATSDFVHDRKAQAGDIVRSTTAEKIGDDRTPLQFIPLRMTNTWTLSEKVDEKYEYRRSEPRNAANEELPYEFVEQGTDWKRVKTINVFALLPKDVAAFQEELKKEDFDMEKSVMPVMLAFRSTSYKAGKAVATFFTNVRGNQVYKPELRAHHYALELTCEQEENDKGKYFVFKVGKSTKQPKEIIVESDKWFNILNTRANDIKVDMPEEGAAAPQAAPVDVTSTSKY